MPIHRRHLLATAAAGLALPWHLTARAQPWPARPIRLVSPYGAGGSNDILTRVLGDFLSRRLGQSIVVENKAGAGTRIANESVAKAAPDGYTLLHAAAPIAIGEALYKELPYDVHKSFAAIGSTAIAPLFLVVNAQAPYKTLAEFIRHAKADPKGATFGSPGAGSAPHLTAELLLRAADAKGVVAQYRGDAPAYTELLAGRIDATLTAISTAVPHIQAGKLRVLGVANEERTPLYPDAPDPARTRPPQRGRLRLVRHARAGRHAGRDRGTPPCGTPGRPGRPGGATQGGSRRPATARRHACRIQHIRRERDAQVGTDHPGRADHGGMMATPGRWRPEAPQGGCAPYRQKKPAEAGQQQPG